MTTLFIIACIIALFISITAIYSIWADKPSPEVKATLAAIDAQQAEIDRILAMTDTTPRYTRPTSGNTKFMSVYVDGVQVTTNTRRI